MAHKTNPRQVTIKTTDGLTLTGKVNIREHERLSDVFTKEDNPFVVIYDAIFEGWQGDIRKVLFMNKKHVIWAEPDDAP